MPESENGVNWNSANGTYTDIVGDRAKQQALRAREMKAEGNSIATIAAALGLSVGRIREYLR